MPKCNSSCPFYRVRTDTYSVAWDGDNYPGADRYDESITHRWCEISDKAVDKNGECESTKKQRAKYLTKQRKALADLEKKLAELFPEDK